MANILNIPASGNLYFSTGTAGASTIPDLSGAAVKLGFDGSGGMNITSYNTGWLERFSVDGLNGRLFGVTDAVTGDIFSVNDAAGLPIINVYSDSGVDVVSIGTYGLVPLMVSGSGTYVTGYLTLYNEPTQDQHAATRRFVTGTSGALQTQITSLNGATGNYVLKSATGSAATLASGFLQNRAYHSGTQTLSTISDAGTIASKPSGDFVNVYSAQNITGIKTFLASGVFREGVVISGGLGVSGDVGVTGSLGLGIKNPSAKIHVIDTSEQLRIGYDEGAAAGFAVDSNGFLDISPSGNKTLLNNTLIFQTAASHGLMSTISSNDLYLQFGDGAVVVEQGGAYVGIGGSPSTFYKFEVFGTSWFQDVVDVGGTYITWGSQGYFENPFSDVIAMTSPIAGNLRLMEWDGANQTVSCNVAFVSSGIANFQTDVTITGSLGVTGNLTLNNEPTLDKHAATKKYVDDAITGVGGGVTDHGALTGLGDDDHPQYFTTGRADARYVQLTATGSAATLASGVLLNRANHTGTQTLSTISDIDELISGYYTPQTLTSSATISWNIASGVQSQLNLAHNTTITITGLNDGQTASLAGTMWSSGSYTVSLTGIGLTTRVMNGALSDIAVLASGDLFEISVKRTNSDLRAWVTTLEV